MKAPTAPAIREKDLREQIRTLVKLFGWRMAFTQYSLRSPKGFPDLVLVRPPRCIFAELKSEVGQLTPEQREWLDSLAQCADGWIGSDTRQPEGRSPIEVYLWRPSHIEGIAEILR